MNKKLNIILSLVMAVAIIAVSGVAYSDKKVASADIGTYDLYCFSDGGVLQGYVNQLITNDVIDTYVMNPCYPSAPSSSYDFWDYIDDIYDDMEVQSIENALIIFEISKAFPVEATDTGGLILPQKLETLFGAWYENGCSIMFISGTTESRFIPYNGFLDYVTIQVDMDLETLWASNVLCQMQSACEEGRIQYATMIMDAFVSVNLQYESDGVNFADNWFFYNYVVPHFKITYYDVLYNNPSYTMREFFEDYGIKVLKHLPGSIPSVEPITLEQQYFKDLMSNEDIQFLSDSEDVIDAYNNDVTVALGSSYYGAVHGLYWEEIMLQMREFYTDFPIYMHNPNATLYQSSISNDFYRVGPFLSIYSCILDFVTNEELAEYHNLPESRCAISYLPMGFGPNGWILTCFHALEELYGSYSGGMIVGEAEIANSFTLYGSTASLSFLHTW